MARWPASGVNLRGDVQQLWSTTSIKSGGLNDYAERITVIVMEVIKPAGIEIPAGLLV